MENSDDLLKIEQEPVEPNPYLKSFYDPSRDPRKAGNLSKPVFKSKSKATGEVIEHQTSVQIPPKIIRKRSREEVDTQDSENMDFKTYLCPVPTKQSKQSKILTLKKGSNIGDDIRLKPTTRNSKSKRLS